MTFPYRRPRGPLSSSVNNVVFILLIGVVFGPLNFSISAPLHYRGRCEVDDRSLQTETSNSLPLYLVVSHCKHDLHWLGTLTNVFNFVEIVVYSKCGYPVEGAPAYSRIKILPNVGRCDHTYAQHIYHMTATEGIVLFVKDTTHVHNMQVDSQTGMNTGKSYSTMITEASGPSQFSCRQYISSSVGIANEAITSYLVKYSISKYNMSIHNYSNPQEESFSIYTNMLKWIHKVGIDLRQPVTPMCYGGIFAVNIERLMTIKKFIWHEIADSLSRADNIEEGHFMERSWAGMLSLEPSPWKNATFPDESTLCFRRNACGYRGHIVYNKAKLKKMRLCARVPRSKIMKAIQFCPPKRKRTVI